MLWNNRVKWVVEDWTVVDSLMKISNLTVPKARNYMVIHHSDRLHKSIANGRTNKLKSTRF